MVLKQVALTEEENDILYDLVLHELRTSEVFGDVGDIVGLTKLLLALHDQFEKFTKPEKLRHEQHKKKVNENTINRAVRQARKRDMQEE